MSETMVAVPQRGEWISVQLQKRNTRTLTIDRVDWFLPDSRRWIVRAVYLNNATSFEIAIAPIAGSNREWEEVE